MSSLKKKLRRIIRTVKPKRPKNLLKHPKRMWILKLIWLKKWIRRAKKKTVKTMVQKISFWETAVQLLAWDVAPWWPLLESLINKTNLKSTMKFSSTLMMNLTLLEVLSNQSLMILLVTKTQSSRSHSCATLAHWATSSAPRKLLTSSCLSANPALITVILEFVSNS